ncbi:hypothetical protein ACSN5C_000447, partial [Escherichia coli]
STCHGGEVLIHACGMWEVCWILLFLSFFVFVFISLFDRYRAIKWRGIQPDLHSLNHFCTVVSSVLCKR